ncbi:CAP domain-containing protein [Streptomyces sp. NPDC094049]|uniref:CAP domain-containing protein n=1 Tax=Streptomyces sp. NPDC094049 TaxID=3154987 RepID=UPI0033259184
MRHHDHPGHSHEPDRARPDGPVRETAPQEAPARAAGRHRGGGGSRRRPPRRPSFRTGVTVAGATAAILTVTTGVYLASPGSEAVTAAPTAGLPAAPPPAPDAPAGAGTASAAPEAVRKAVRTPSPLPPVTPATAATPSPRAATTAPVRPSATTTAPKAESERRPAQPREKAPQQGAAPEAPAAGTAKRFIKEVVALANTEREKAGCGPLRTEARLRSAAQGHADDMAARDYYEHDSPEGRDAGDRMTGAGYAWSTWGENIHRGPKTPALAMEDWMNSPGHRANILNCSFKDIGVGVTLTANGPWWVQNFGARS